MSSSLQVCVTRQLYTLLRICSKIRTLLGVKILSGVTNFLVGVVCSIRTTCIKVASTEVASTEVASTEGTCTGSFCIGATSIRGIEDTSIRVTCMRDTV